MLEERKRGIGDFSEAPKTPIYTRVNLLLLSKLYDFLISIKFSTFLRISTFQFFQIYHQLRCRLLPIFSYWWAKLADASGPRTKPNQTTLTEGGKSEVRGERTSHALALVQNHVRGERNHTWIGLLEEELIVEERKAKSGGLDCELSPISFSFVSFSFFLFSFFC